MFKNIYSMFISFPLLMGSILMIFFSLSWFSQWMIMEINLIGFLSLIIFEKKTDIIFVMEYYLLQSILSFMFLFLTNHFYFMNELYLNLLIFLINMILFTKIGMPPFFFWYLSFCKNLSWNNLLLMFIFQKIIPLLIMLNLNNFMIFNNNNLLNMILLMIVILSSFICSLLSISSLNLKLLMTYSSIIQMSWLLILMFLNEIYFMLYFFIYFIVVFSLIKIFNKFNFLELNSLNLMYLNKNWMNLLLLISLFSLSGVPPFLGFMIKWISLYMMSNLMSYYLMFMLILNSLISIFFYFRVMYMSFFFSNFSIKLNYFMFFMKLNFSNYFIIFIILNLYGLLFYEFF